MDVVAFLGSLVADGLEAALAQRTQNFHDLVWQRAENSFEVAIEVSIPEAQRLRLAHQSYDTMRYEVAVGYDPATNQVGILAEQALGRSRGGFSTKIHISVDGLGNPLQILLTAGQRHDISQADSLINGYNADFVIDDKGYDSETFRQQITNQGTEPVIPPRRNKQVLEDYDDHLSKKRHLVECCINKLKHYRRIFPRFEKLARRYAGFI